MPKRPKLRPDMNEVAFRIVQAATEDGPRPQPPGGAEKNPEAAKRGRKGSPDVILAAIDELRTSPKSNFCKMPRKQSRQLVLDLLRSRGVEVDQKGNGLSPQNISKLILQRCPKRRIKISENK